MNVHFLIFPTSCPAHRSLRIPETHFLRFPTSCSAHRSPRIPGSAFFLDFRRYNPRTGVPEILKVHFLYFQRFVLRTGVPEFLKVRFEKKFCPRQRRCPGQVARSKKSPNFEKKSAPGGEAARDKWLVQKKSDF